MKENGNGQIKSSDDKKHSNGNNGNGHSPELKAFMKNRERRLLEIYGRKWTSEEIEALRKEIEQANERAEKIRKEWELA